jgi:hypothetical protein
MTCRYPVLCYRWGRSVVDCIFLAIGWPRELRGHVGPFAMAYRVGIERRGCCGARCTHAIPSPSFHPACTEPLSDGPNSFDTLTQEQQ